MLPVMLMPPFVFRAMLLKSEPAGAGPVIVIA